MTKHKKYLKAIQKLRKAFREYIIEKLEYKSEVLPDEISIFVNHIAPLSEYDLNGDGLRFGDGQGIDEIIEEYCKNSKSFDQLVFDELTTKSEG